METEARFDVVRSSSPLSKGEVLRVLLRLARRGLTADAAEILRRTDGTALALRVALRALEQDGLVVRTGQESACLTMSGFAVATALLANRRKKVRSIAQLLPKRIVRKRAA